MLGKLLLSKIRISKYSHRIMFKIKLRFLKFYQCHVFVAHAGRQCSVFIQLLITILLSQAHSTQHYPSNSRFGGMRYCSHLHHCALLQACLQTASSTQGWLHASMSTLLHKVSLVRKIIQHIASFSVPQFKQTLFFQTALLLDTQVRVAAHETIIHIQSSRKQKVIKIDFQCIV